MRLLERGDVIINEIEASWIGYRSQGVQPVFVEVVNPVQAELIKVQREVFNRVLENLKPGVTVGELADLTKRTAASAAPKTRSEEHTSELQSHHDLVCRLLLEKKNK